MAASNEPCPMCTGNLEANLLPVMAMDQLKAHHTNVTVNGEENGIANGNGNEVSEDESEELPQPLSAKSSSSSNATRGGSSRPDSYR